MAFEFVFDTCADEIAPSDTQLVDADGTVVMNLPSSHLRHMGPVQGWSLYSPELSRAQREELTKSIEVRTYETEADREARLRMLKSGQTATGALMTSWCV